QLPRARRIRDVRVCAWQPVTGVGLSRDIATVVRVVEEVEHFDHAVDLQVSDVEPLLEPHVYSVDWETHEIIARHDGPVWTEATVARGPHLTQVSAVAGREALPGTVEVQPAQLDAVSRFINAVEDCAMTLVEDGVGLLPAKIQRKWKSNVGRRLIVLGRAQRVGCGTLPALAQSF